MQSELILWIMVLFLVSHILQHNKIFAIYITISLLYMLVHCNASEEVIPFVAIMWYESQKQLRR